MAVAILIVNYKVYEELDRALASIAPLVRPGDEVVVVDQESRADRLAEMTGRYPDVRFLPSAVNAGFAGGVNMAARASRAPFLLLLNPDAVVEGPAIRTLESWLATHPDTGVVGPRVVNADGSIQPSARRFPNVTTALAGRSTWLTKRFPENPLSRWNLPAQDAATPVDVDWLAGSCFMTRRDLFETLGGLDESFFLYWEDADYCRRASREGYRSVYLPTVTVRHIAGRSAAHDPAPAIRAFHASAARFYEKHAGPVGRFFAPVARAGLWLRGEWRARRVRRGT